MTLGCRLDMSTRLAEAGQEGVRDATVKAFQRASLPAKAFENEGSETSRGRSCGSGQ